MNYVEAAIAVLASAARPLTTREVTDEATSRGLLSPSGRTPEASMSAALYRTANSPTNPGIKRLFRKGARRAVRGTVRWVWDSRRQG